MPSKERYAREKAAAAARGTTPYRERIRSAQKRAPGLKRRAARGHGRPDETLTARRKRREARQVLGQGPNGYCVVCGSKIEEGRSRSYTDRICGNEQVRRWREAGSPKDLDGGSFEFVARLARDQLWVHRRRAESRAAGIPLRRPRGVRLEERVG